MLTRKRPSTPEPPPKPEGELVTPPLIAWLEARGHAAAAQLVRERDAYGRTKYGQGLMTGDGRDTIEDLRQELGDAMQYAWKARMQGLKLTSVDNLVGVLRSIVSAWDGAAIAIDIMLELARADAKYGREENLPDVEPVLMNRPGGCTAQRMAEEYEIPTRWRAQMMCEQSKRASHLTSAHLVIEELCEAVEAATIAPEELRAELVQVGAMVVKWIRNIDRRDGR